MSLCPVCKRGRVIVSGDLKRCDRCGRDIKERLSSWQEIKHSRSTSPSVAVDPVEAEMTTEQLKHRRMVRMKQSKTYRVGNDFV